MDVIAPSNLRTTRQTEVSRSAFQERATLDVVAAIDLGEPIGGAALQIGVKDDVDLPQGH